MRRERTLSDMGIESLQKRIDAQEAKLADASKKPHLEREVERISVNLQQVRIIGSNIGAGPKGTRMATSQADTHGFLHLVGNPMASSTKVHSLYNT